jgi:fluoride ion exporter CrcB/FEX
MSTSLKAETRFPSIGSAALAGLLATAMLIALGTVVGAGARWLVMNVLKNQSLGWLVIVVNLISHAAAIALAVLLMRFFSGPRAELLRLTILLMVGYAVIVFFSTLFQEMGTPLLIAGNNVMPSGLRLMSFVVWFAVPAVIAFAILVFAGHRDRSTRS